MKGVARIYVDDQTHFKVGKIIIICELFMAQVIGLGSLVLDRPLDRDYPAGSPIREVTPADDHVVDARGRTIINGVVMDPASSSQDNPNARDVTTIRQLPPRPSEGVLSELQNESKLYTWLLQGMALRGKAHWKECADYYERYEPTALEVYPKEDTIKYDQYTKAFNQIGPVPSTEGRLMTVVEQVVVFEQNLLRMLKGLSPACEFYAKLLLHGVYHFLEQLRGLKTATEQATQTFAASQAEERFHPQLEALLVTWLSNKLPEVVRKRAHNRRPQPSARILLTEFYFTLFPQPDDQAKHLGNIARHPTSTSQNTTDVIVNIETWRTSIQMLKDISGHIPMKEDIRSAFEKLIAPLAKNNAPFSLTKTLCEREAYMAITTTHDDVYKYIISIMEAIHKLPKNTKWESTKPKAQAINTGTSNGESIPNKGKGKGKGKKKGPPLPDGKGKGGKGKGNPSPSSGATSSTTPAPQVSMLRVDRQQLEPEPEPVRRHPVAEWRPHSGPTRENHPKFLLPTEEAVVPMSPHMAGQHSEHIVFGANQHACWLRCTLCEKTSRRVLYRYTICMKCPGRRRDDYEPLWETSTRCVLAQWNCLLLRLFWMGSEDKRTCFAQAYGIYVSADNWSTLMTPRIWRYSMRYTPAGSP